MDPVRTATGGSRVFDDLVEEIADALAVSSEYTARVDLLPTQRLVDFHWAAHQAGRRLGVKVKVEVVVPKDTRDARAAVRVRPRRPHDPR